MPTHKVMVELGGVSRPRLLTFYPSQETADAFAAGLAHGVALAGGEVVHGRDDGVWRGLTSAGETVRMEVAELGDEVVSLDETKLAGVF